MSEQAVVSSGQQAGGDEAAGVVTGGVTASAAAAVVAAVDLPDPANTVVEEKNGKGCCLIRYQYEAEKGDHISWTMEDVEGGFVILFTVRRLNSERVVFLKRSKRILGKYKDNLVVKNKDLNLKKQLYLVQLEKTADFNLEGYFRPESPPV